jgi:hypothetical protein
MACETTEPDRFYCKRKGNRILKGFEEMRMNLCSALRQLQVDGFSVQQMLFIHSGKEKTTFTQGALLVRKENPPKFFDKVGALFGCRVVVGKYQGRTTRSILIANCLKFGTKSAQIHLKG